MYLQGNMCGVTQKLSQTRWSLLVILCNLSGSCYPVNNLEVIVRKPLANEVAARITIMCWLIWKLIQSNISCWYACHRNFKLKFVRIWKTDSNYNLENHQHIRSEYLLNEICVDWQKYPHGKGSNTKWCFNGNMYVL